MSRRQHLLIDCATLHQLNDPHLLLIDATVILHPARFDGDYRVESGRASWQQARIAGAIHLDMLDDFANTEADYSFAVPKLEQAQRFLQQLGLSQHSNLVIYDSRGGLWAARLWWILASFSVSSRVLDGGLDAWRAAGYPLEKGPAAHRAVLGDIQLCAQAGYWADLAQVKAASEAQDTTLICALDEAQFFGRRASRYPRRGAIPNSLHFSARQLLGSDQCFLQDAEIRQLLMQQQIHVQGKILYCGGGILACLLALGLRLLSDEDFSIYDGSLQEWASHTALPLLSKE